MSQPNCDACNELREYAPEFVLQGVTENVATSLENNTGLNPNLTVLHTDCEDLHDINDCLIGRMTDEVETYDVCDWKDFMKKFLGNLYETLKAMIAAICGLWKRTDKLCESDDAILGMLGGDRYKQHLLTKTGTFSQKFAVTSSPWPSSDVWLSIDAEHRGAAGCEADKDLIMIGFSIARKEDHWPALYVVGVSNLAKGDILGTIRKEDLIADINEDIWLLLMRGHEQSIFSIGYISASDTFTSIYVRTRGYIVIDGQEFNTDLKSGYGPDVLTVQIIGFSSDDARTGTLLAPQDIQDGVKPFVNYVF